MLQYSPIAVPSVLYAYTVTTLNDDLLRTSTGRISPAPSPTVYVDCSNVTKVA